MVYNFILLITNKLTLNYDVFCVFCLTLGLSQYTSTDNNSDIKADTVLL